MKDVKRRGNRFELYDYQGVESHLESMAAKGWRLERAGPRIWTYRRAKPAKIRYAVTYIPDSSQFNPGPTESQKSLADLCAAAGWEKVCDWYQMQIFVSELEDPVPLENDEALRLQVIHRSMKRNFLPGNTFLLLLSLVMAALWVKTLAEDPIRLFLSNAYLFAGVLWVLAPAAELVSLGNYWLWYRRSSRSVSGGGTCAAMGRLPQWINRAAMVLLGLLCAAYLLSECLTSNPRTLGFLAVYLALFAALGILVRGTTVLLRRKGVSWGKNLAGTLAVDIVLVFAVVGGLTFLAIRYDWFGHGGATYVIDHLEWDVEPIEIPLTVSDLTGREYPHIHRRYFQSGSVFLTRQEYRDRVRSEGDKGFESISYELTETRNAWLYRKTVEDLTRPEIASPWDIEWMAEDPGPWGAEAVYRRYMDGEPSRRYVLCYPERIVEFSPDEEPTAAQMAIVGGRLGS